MGSQPRSLAFDGSSVWATNSASNSVDKLRAGDGVRLGTFISGSQPQGIAFDGANLWVANLLSNTLSKF